MTSAGYGRLVGFGLDPTALLPRPDLPLAAGPDVANHWFWATGLAAPPPPVEIPLSWLDDPIPFRLERAVNDATVAQTGGTTSHSTDDSSVDEYTVNEFRATLETRIQQDAANLASFAVDYGGEPRMRSPRLVLDLMHRTDVERWRILRVRQGQRIQITDVPASFPAGADSLVVSGIRHIVGVAVRRVQWTTTAVVGEVAGVPGPWFYLGDSAMDGTDLMPY